MKFRLPALLLIVLSAQVGLAYQPSRLFQLSEIHPTAQSKAAQDQAMAARKRLILVNDNAQKVMAAAATNNSPDAQAKAAEAQQQVADAKQAVQTADTAAKQAQAEPVSQQDWNNMQTVLKGAKDRYESNMDHYSTLATSLVVAGILLSLAGAFAGFLRKAIAAGIISILVTALVGIPKLFPISQRAEYFRALFIQSSSLYVQSQLRLSHTAADYNEFVTDIRVLADYEMNKFPSGGDVAEKHAEPC